MKKKLLALLLAVVMVVSLLPVTAFATEPTEIEIEKVDLFPYNGVVFVTLDYKDSTFAAYFPIRGESLESGKTYTSSDFDEIGISIGKEDDFDYLESGTSGTIKLILDQDGNATYVDAEMTTEKGTYHFTYGTAPVTDVKYYAKNNWGGGEWTWKEMTKFDDNTYILENVIFGDTGVNINIKEDDATAAWFEVANILYEHENGVPYDEIPTIPKGAVVSFRLFVPSDMEDWFVDYNKCELTIIYDKVDYTKYYLCGYINDSTVSSTQSDLQFDSDGKLILQVDNDSYVYIMTSEDCFRPSAYHADGTAVALIKNIANTEVVCVPKGIIIFSLVENNDGTLTFSYTIYTPPVSTHDLTVTKIGGGILIEGTVDSHDGADYYWDENTLYILKNGLSVSGTTTSELIWICEESVTDLTIENLSMTISDDVDYLNPIYFYYDATLTLVGDNTIISSGAPIIFLKNGEITGEGNLTVQTTVTSGILAVDGSLLFTQTGTITTSGAIGIEVMSGGTISFNEGIGDIIAHGSNSSTSAIYGDITLGIILGNGLTMKGSANFDAEKSNINGDTVIESSMVKTGGVAALSVLISANTAVTTVADVLKTAENDFPSSSDGNAPSNAWVNSNNEKMFSYEGNFYIAGESDGDFVLSANTTLTKDGNNYKCTTVDGVTVTFIMDDGALTSISIEGLTDYAKLNGTYKAPAPVPVTAIDWAYDPDWRDVYVYSEDATYLFELKEETGGLTYGTTYTFADMIPDWTCTLDKEGYPLVKATDATLTVTKDEKGLVHIVATMVLDGNTYTFTYDEKGFEPSGKKIDVNGTDLNGRYMDAYGLYLYTATWGNYTVQLAFDAKEEKASYTNDDLIADYCVIYSDGETIELLKLASDTITVTTVGATKTFSGSIYATNGDEYVLNLTKTTTYAITDGTAKDANGSITVAETAAEGETVTVTVTPDEGYQLKTLKYNDGEDHTINVDKDGKYTFTMPAKAVTVTAEFEKIHTHNIVKVTGQPATETAAGWSDYYECKDDEDACHKYFEDATAEVEITDLDAWKAQGGAGYIAPLVHSITPVNGKDATDTEAGYKPYYECKNCGKYYEDATGHIEIPDIDAWKSQTGKGYIPSGNEINAAKTAAKAALDSENAKDALLDETALTNGKSAIDSAETLADIENAKDAAITAIQQAQATELAGAKTNAKSALDTEEAKDPLTDKTALTNGKNSIDSATTKAAVEEAKNNALDAIKNAQKSELDAAKANAKSALDTEEAKDPLTDKTALTNGKNSIDSATTKAAVEEAKNNALDAIKNAQKSELDAAKANAKSALDTEEAKDPLTDKTALTNGKNSIDSATTKAAVEAAKNAAITAIQEAQAGELANAKTNAKAALDTEEAKDPLTDKTALTNGKNSIDSATTKAAVEEAKNNALDAIKNAQKSELDAAKASAKSALDTEEAKDPLTDKAPLITGKSNIDSATTKAAVEAAKNAAITAIQQAQATELAGAKTNAKSALDTEEAKDPLTDKAPLITGKSNIDSATTKAAVEDAKNAAITAIQQAQATELAGAKDAAKSALDTEEAKDPLTDKVPLTTGKSNIDSATTKAAVEDAKNAAITAIQQAQATELAGAKDAAKSALDTEEAKDPLTDKTALTNGKNSIDSATTKAAVEAAKNAAITAIQEAQAGEHKDPTSPQTGDNSHMTLWVMLMALSSMGLCACLVLGKKRKKEQ